MRPCREVRGLISQSGESRRRRFKHSCQILGHVCQRDLRVMVVTRLHDCAHTGSRSCELEQGLASSGHHSSQRHHHQHDNYALWDRQYTEQEHGARRYDSRHNHVDLVANVLTMGSPRAELATTARLQLCFECCYAFAARPTRVHGASSKTIYSCCWH